MADAEDVLGSSEDESENDGGKSSPALSNNSNDDASNHSSVASNASKDDNAQSDAESDARSPAEEDHSHNEQSGDENENQFEAESQDAESDDGRQEREADNSEASESGDEAGSRRSAASPRSVDQEHSDGEDDGKQAGSEGGETANEQSEDEGNVGEDDEKSDDERAKSDEGDEGHSNDRQMSDGENQMETDADRHQSENEGEGESGGEQEPLNKQFASSDEEGEQEKAAETAAEDLFGDADDISDESGNEDKGPAEEKEEEGQQEMTASVYPVDDEEEGGEPIPEEIPETRIDVEIPKITADLGKELNFVKLPNFLSVETRPFDPQTYEDEIDEDEVLDEEGRARLKLKVENTVRWRWGFDDDGNPVRESNARIVRWSDGSMSLHLGEEIFDVHKQQLQCDHNHLFIRQGTGLQGQAVFRTKLTFRPHSTDSFTHRKITISVADRSQKIQKIRVLPNVGKDPEAHRTEMIKREEDRLKASIRRESKQRRVKERAQSRGLSSLYLENDQYDDDDDDDEGAISLSAIKNKYKKGAFRDSKPIYSSDSEASDIDDRRSRRLEKAKALADSDEERDTDSSPKKKMARIEESDEEEDDDDDEDDDAS